jgi:hypothetical protein
MARWYVQRAIAFALRSTQLFRIFHQRQPAQIVTSIGLDGDQFLLCNPDLLLLVVFKHAERD